VVDEREEKKEQESIPRYLLKKPRIYVKPHGGAWKVAYADFVTAMMALFIVLWVMSQDQSVIQGVTTYFKDPAAKKVRVGNPAADGSNRQDSDHSKGSKEWKELQKEQLKGMGDLIQQELSRSPEFKELADQIKFEIVNEGLRTELVESADDIFFGIGASMLKERAQGLLKRIGSHLARLPNKLVVEGHTDSRPFVSGVRGYSNFELSAERANVARRTLIDSGVEEKVIDEVRGYADRRLREATDPFSYINRRISIIVKYTEQK
jgi:chemotaxis protein MotB